MRYLYILLFAVLASSAVDAQLSIKLNFNVDSQPAWGPTGYDHVEYYYLPDIETYYNVSEHRFYYYEGGRWIGRSHLPPRYNNYDFYGSYKVVINEKEPYRHNRRFRRQYGSYKGHHDQQMIRDSRDSKYFGNKDHPEHNNWIKQHGHDKNNERDNHNKHDKKKK